MVLAVTDGWRCRYGSTARAGAGDLEGSEADGWEVHLEEKKGAFN